MRSSLIRRFEPRFFAVVIGILVLAGAVDDVRAQGVQTGVLTGVANDPEGLPVPGVTVTVTSAALQGARTVVTDEIGVYLFRGLPPGSYRVRFELPGLAPVEETIDVPLGATAKLDAKLSLGTVQEAMNVVAETPTPLVSTQASANFKAELINTLPVGRTPAQIAELAPGMTDNTPNAGQVAIGGAFGFDSIFLVDGVDTNDNLFGSSNTLFIEDAIQETQVLTSGISAEYGRFAGGVVNVITKSGGNAFHGSFRTNLAKPSWTDETPFEQSRNQQRSDQLSQFYEGTIGGPIVRDRLWFFNADRYEDSQTGNVLAEVGTPYDTGNNNKRFELKLTGTLAPTQTVSGSYLNNPRTQTDVASINTQMSMDPATLIAAETPNDLWVVNWQGVLTPSVFGTFQYSRKEWTSIAGGTSTTITDSPFISRGVVSGVPANRHYNAPYFSAIDPEDRNNQQFAGSVSYFTTNRGSGRHDLKGGFEHFTSTRTGGGSQTSTGYRFDTDYLLGPDGRPVLDSVGHPIPVFGGNPANPAAAASRVINWISTPGSQIDIRTLSLYVQDKWTVGPRATFDLGLRYEIVRSDATGDIIGVDTNTALPRLGATYDLSGDGLTIVQGTYGHYAGRYTERALGRNTSVGTPSQVVYGYVGPSGSGRDFAPGFNLSNYAFLQANFPTANVFFDDGLHSPVTREFTLSLGRTLPRDSYAKAIYIWRQTNGFIEDFIDDPTAAGKVAVSLPNGTTQTVDRVVYRNTDEPSRDYQALQFMSRARFTSRLWVEGHWTVQLENNGDFEGEAANQPGNPELFFNYPEILDPDRYFPTGRLNEFQRHKVRLWTTYVQGLGRFGSLDISPIWRVNSGLTYTLAATNVAHTATMLARNPGYVRTGGGGTAANLFFDERGSESFKGYGLLDLAVNYSIPVWKELRPWVLLQVFNLLDNDKLIQWDTSVTPDPNSARDENGQPTGFVRGANFGLGTAATHYPVWAPGQNGGRTFRVAFGVRF